MALKKGKHNSGRTVRSYFPRRSEGILVLEKRLEDKADKVFYSLGKQNRWMMPEMVKEIEHGTDFGDEDFVMVDRRLKRHRFMSIYESESRNISETKDSAVIKAKETRDVNMVFEISSENHKGIWTFEKRIKSSNSSKKKSKATKGRHCNVYLEKEWEETDGTYYDYDDRDYNENAAETSIEFDSIILGDFMPATSVINKETTATKQAENPNGIKTNGVEEVKRKVIFVDDKEQIEKHKTMHSLTQRRDTLLKAIVNNYNYIERCKCSYCLDMLKVYEKRKVKRQNYLRKKLLQVFEHKGELNQHKSQKLQEVKNVDKKDEKCFVCCEANLIADGLKMSELQHVWGEKYIQGRSYPDKFMINLSGICALVSRKTGLDLAHVLFELKDKDTVSSASITLFVASEELKARTLQLIMKDFSENINSKTISVQDVIDNAKKCIKKHLADAQPNKHQIHPHTGSVPLKSFEEFTGWKGKVYTEKDALDMVQEGLNTSHVNGEKSLIPCYSDNMECGICFESLIDPKNFTMLTTCEHSFCNDCWTAHLETKLKSGQTNGLCPEHSCKTIVDPVTIMSLAPSCYGKYFSWKTKRALAADKHWKHCPSDTCNMVMNIQTSESKPIPVGLPVSCACKRIWCYQCQEQAHWPSTCDHARKFRAANKGSLKSTSEITSVDVKKCPKCSYPIEKFHGCDHMYCAMCNTDFCWACLKVLNQGDEIYYGHDCNVKKQVKASAVKIPLLYSDAQRTVNKALKSSLIVKAGFSLKKIKRIQAVQQGMDSYLSLKNICKIFQSSRLGKLLESNTTTNLPEVLTDVYRFELQANITLEGMAICVIHDDKKLFEQFMILSYFMEKVAEILNTPLMIFKSGSIARLNQLVLYGTQCLKRVNMKKKQY